MSLICSNKSCTFDTYDCDSTTNLVAALLSHQCSSTVFLLAPQWIELTSWLEMSFREAGKASQYVKGPDTLHGMACTLLGSKIRLEPFVAIPFPGGLRREGRHYLEVQVTASASIELDGSEISDLLTWHADFNGRIIEPQDDAIAIIPVDSKLDCSSVMMHVARLETSAESQSDHWTDALAIKQFARSIAATEKVMTKWIQMAKHCISQYLILYPDRYHTAGLALRATSYGLRIDAFLNSKYLGLTSESVIGELAIMRRTVGWSIWSTTEHLLLQQLEEEMDSTSDVIGPRTRIYVQRV